MKKIIINQQEQVIFGIIIALNMEVTVIETKHDQLKNILIKLEQEITNNLKKFDTRKIQSKIAMNDSFMSSKENDEESVMHSQSDNI